MKKRTAIILAIGLVLFSLNVYAAKMEKHEYIVKQGDTPSDIFYVLWNFYQIKPDQVIEWNPKMSLRKIYPGQKIIYYVQPRSDNLSEKIQEQLSDIEIALDQIGANQTVNKIISQATKEGNQEIFNQIDEMRNFQEQQQRKQNSVIKTGNQEIFNQIDEMKNFQEKGLILLVLCLTVLGLPLIKKSWVRRKKREKEERPEVEFTIDNVKYVYQPEIDKDGRYLSVYRPRGEKLAFKSIIDLRKSVQSVFKKDPALIKQEIKAGRLKTI